MKKNLLPLKKHLSFQVLTSKQLGRWLTHHRLMAIKHLPDKEELINKVFKNCVIMTFLMRVSKSAKNKILSILEFQQKNKWMIFLDKLNLSNDLNTLTIQLFKTLVQELILKEKDYKPFWNHAYNELSEKLLLPIETDYADLHLNSLKHSYKRQVELSPYLTMITTSAKKKNFLKTSSLLSTSLIADKWENALTKLKINPKKQMKTIIIKLYPSKNQSKILDEFIDTHRYVYNRTLEYIKNGYEPYFEYLRDLLATEKTRKNYSCNTYYNMYIESIKNKNMEKKDKEIIINEIKNLIKELPLKLNPLINKFELNTSNEIRSNAIKSVCDAYKTGISNLKAGNIKYFNISYKKKTENKKCIELASSDLKFCNNGIKISPTKFPKKETIIKIHKDMQNKYKDLIIKHNSDLVKFNGEYFIHITVQCKEIKETKVKKLKFCGVDPGVRDFISIYGNNELTSITLKKDVLKKLNDKIKLLKSKRAKPLKECQRNKIRKCKINKVEKKKINITNELHWNVINYLIKTQDVIFFGDIKSHGIVKGNLNKTLNRNFNDLKFYKFKQRLLYKCILNKKKVFFTNEAYTSQGCSSCGNLWKDIKSSKIYNCQNVNCRTKNVILDRDFNAAKNICMKGILHV